MSLKLPMDSQCIQASNSKSTSVPNVSRDFYINIARQGATLTKMLKWCFVWQYEYGSLSLHITVKILLQKYLFNNGCLDSCWSIVVKKWNDISSQKVCLIIIHINTTHILDISCCYKDQQGIIMKIVKYLLSYYCMPIYFFLWQKTFQLCLNVLPHITKLCKTWIGHDATRYYNFNALPHALLYIFSQFTLTSTCCDMRYHIFH